MLNILDKVIKLIILKCSYYIVEAQNILLSIYIKIKKQYLIDTILQLIIDKIYAT